MSPILDYQPVLSRRERLWNRALRARRYLPAIAATCAWLPVVAAGLLGAHVFAMRNHRWESFEGVGYALVVAGAAALILTAGSAMQLIAWAIAVVSLHRRRGHKEDGNVPPSVAGDADKPARRRMLWCALTISSLWLAGLIALLAVNAEWNDVLTVTALFIVGYAAAAVRAEWFLPPDLNRAARTLADFAKGMVLVIVMREVCAQDLLGRALPARLDLVDGLVFLAAVAAGHVRGRASNGDRPIRIIACMCGAALAVPDLTLWIAAGGGVLVLVLVRARGVTIPSFATIRRICLDH